MAMPPRLIVLIVSPIHFNARIDTSSESGSATSEMTRRAEVHQKDQQDDHDEDRSF